MNHQWMLPSRPGCDVGLVTEVVAKGVLEIQRTAEKPLHGRGFHFELCLSGRGACGSVSCQWNNCDAENLLWSSVVFILCRRFVVAPAGAYGNCRNGKV